MHLLKLAATAHHPQSALRRRSFGGAAPISGICYCTSEGFICLQPEFDFIGGTKRHKKVFAEDTLNPLPLVCEGEQ